MICCILLFLVLQQFTITFCCFYALNQRGPITFDPRATLQKHDTLRATSKKNVTRLKITEEQIQILKFFVEKTDLQDLNKKTAKISEGENGLFIANLLQWDACV